jgi:CheY-like chemotaxis protein
MNPTMPCSTSLQHHYEVLIVAESPDDAYLLEAILQASGLGFLHCIAATSLEEAREHLESSDFDAALLAIGRPDLCGLKRLHALSVMQRVPIVVVAARDDEWLRRQAMKRGAVDFVPEHHVEPERLSRAIRRAVQYPFHERRPTIVNPTFDAHAKREERAQSDPHDSIRTILNEVCLQAHDRFAEDLHIILEAQGPACIPANPTIAREAFESLLLGLTTACRELDAGSLELHIRTGATANSVLVSIDAVTDQHAEQYRDLVLDTIVGQSDAALPDSRITQGTSAIRDLGGVLRCRACDDARLWVQVCLPNAHDLASVVS